MELKLLTKRPHLFDLDHIFTIDECLLKVQFLVRINTWWPGIDTDFLHTQQFDKL